MVYENDGRLDGDAAQYACYCLSVAHYKPDISDEEFNTAWEAAKSKKILDSGDVLERPQGFVDLLGYPLTYKDGHWAPDTPVDPATMHLVGEWQRTKDDGTVVTHFVQMDGKGTARENVFYDPIEGGSLTVKFGAFVSYRIFLIRG
jgi:hypothetical protein